MEATPDPYPDDAPKPQDPRLVPFFAVRKRLELRLTREARASGLDPTTCVWLVDEVLERLSERYLREDPPDSAVAWSVQVMKNLFTEIRESPYFFLLEGDPMDEHDHQGDQRIPGLHDFWAWVDTHSQVLESCFTPLEWRAFLATKNAPTIEEAATRCEQTPRDYRNRTNRAGGKIFSAILRNLVPPPLLKGEQQQNVRLALRSTDYAVWRVSRRARDPRGSRIAMGTSEGAIPKRPSTLRSQAMIKTALYAILSTFLAGSFVFAAAHIIGDPDYCDCTLLSRTNSAGEFQLSCGGACTQGNCVLEMLDLDWDSCGCPDQETPDLCNCFGLRSSDPNTPLNYNCQTLAGQCNNNKTCYKRPTEEFWQDACECR